MEKPMVVTHEPAKRAGLCILCGQFFYAKDPIVTWVKPDPIEGPDTRVAAHEACYSAKIWGGKK